MILVRSLILVAIFFSAGAGKAGTWPQQRQNASGNAYVPVKIPDVVHVDWTIATGAYSGNSVTLATDETSLYFLNSGTGILGAYNLSDGQARWVTAVPNPGGSPAVADGKVFVASQSDPDSNINPLIPSTPAFIAYNVSDGSVSWKTFTDILAPQFTSDPCAGSWPEGGWVSVPGAGLVAYGNGGNEWEVLGTTSGNCVTVQALEAEFFHGLFENTYVSVGHPPMFVGSPVALDGVAYSLGTPCVNCHLRSYDTPWYDTYALSSGSAVQQTVVNASTSNPVPVSTGPCSAGCPSNCPFTPSAPAVNVGDGNVLLVTSDHLLCRRHIMPLPSAEGIRNPELVDPASRLLSARDRSTGAVLWRAVPASDLGGDPLGVQLELQQVWEFSSRISKITSTVTVAEAHGRIVLLSPNKLMTLDSATGCTLNSRAVTASTMVTLTDNAILFGDIGGNVHIVDPVTLNEVQVIHAVDAPLMGEVAVTDGAMFVVAGDGTITKLVADGCRTRSPGYPQNGHQGIGPGGVNTLSGNLVFSVKDVSLPFAGLSIALVRTYNSQLAESVSRFTPSGTLDMKVGGGVTRIPFASALGPGWTHDYQMVLRPQFDEASGSTLYVEDRGDGRTVGFTVSATGTINPPGVEDELISSTPGNTCGDGACLRKKHGLLRSFNADGDMVSMADPDGNQLLLTYTPTATFKVGAVGSRLMAIMYVSSSMNPGKPVTATVFLDYEQVTGLLAKVRSPNPDGGPFLETKYSYSNGLLASVDGPGGIYHAAYTYDDQNRMTEKLEPRAPEGLKHMRFYYDDGGRVADVKTPSLLPIAKYRYTAGFLTPEQIADGVADSHITTVTQFAKTFPVQTTYTYDDCSLLRSVKDGLGHETRYSWDARFHELASTDANDHQTSWTYDTRGNVLSVTDAKSGQATYQYEPQFNHVIQKTDANGHTEELEYDAAGNLILITKDVVAIPELGESSTKFFSAYEYDGRGLRIAARDANGNQSHYEYDGTGNMTSTDRVLQTSPTTSKFIESRYEYDEIGRRIAKVDPIGNRTEFEYDLENRLVHIRSGIVSGGTPLAETMFHYDSLNRLILRTDLGGRSTSYGYNDQDFMISSQDALMQETRFEYDSMGNRTKVTDPNGRIATFEYDAAVHLVAVHDAASGVATAAYDPAGNLLSMTDPGGAKTSYVYDELNRPTQMTHGDGFSETFQYDAVGNKILRTDGLGVQTALLYDSLNRVRRVRYPNEAGTPTVTLKYDAVSNRTEAKTSIAGQDYVVDDTFDSLNRITRESIDAAGGAFVAKRIAYDDAGNRLQLVVDAVASSGDDLELDYTYDGLHRLSSVNGPGGTVFSEYDLSGNLVHIGRPNDTETALSYDVANRLTLLRNQRMSSGAALSFSEYTYDKMDNRTSRRTETGLTTFEYDDLYRLKNVTPPAYYAFSYGYDAAGNRQASQKGTDVGKAYTYLTGNRLGQVKQGSDQTIYAWDEDGRVTDRTDPDGIHVIYTFDATNDLRQVTTPQTTIGFEYDPDGHRVYRTEGGNATWFVFDGLSCLMELGADKKPTAVMVPGISKTRLDLPTPLTEFSLHDGLGSVVQLTDGLGNLTQEYQYEPFGLVQDNGTDRHNRYRFAGLAHEDALGLIYMNARWYDPNAGRFLSRDPVVGGLANPQSLNPYIYALNNPISRADETGLYSSWGPPPSPIPGVSSVEKAQVEAAVGAVNYAGAVVETTAGIGIAGAGMIGGGAMAGAGVAGAIQAESFLTGIGGLGIGAVGISAAWSSWAGATGQPFSPGAQLAIDVAAGGTDVLNALAHPSWSNAADVAQDIGTIAGDVGDWLMGTGATGTGGSSSGTGPTTPQDMNLGSDPSAAYPLPTPPGQDTTDPNGSPSPPTPGYDDSYN